VFDSEFDSVKELLLSTSILIKTKRLALMNTFDKRLVTSSLTAGDGSCDQEHDETFSNYTEYDGHYD